MLNNDFLEKVQPLYSADLGTENVAGLLYSMVRMLRPQSLLEIGLGYTTPFLLQALHDNVAQRIRDQQCLANQDDALRLEVLRAEAHSDDYKPRLIAVDDMSDEDSTAPEVAKLIKTMGLDDLMLLCQRSFVGLTASLDQALLPLDFVWFDCGGPQEYADFLSEYWQHINPDGGVLLIHYCYWHMPTVQNRRIGTPITPARLEPSAMLREIKRQHGLLGLDANFEVATIVEPNKSRQGSVTMVRKVMDQPVDGQGDMTEELEAQGFPGPYAQFSL